MFLSQKFIYNEDASEGSGAADTPVVNQPFFSADEAKQFGFDNKETFTEFIRQQKEASKPDAEKQKQAEVEKANFLKYSTENDLLKIDEYNQYESLNGKQDKDLIYDKFVKEFKEDNPDIEGNEIEEEAKNAFDNEYKLNSKNEKVKTRGEARLKKEAEDLRLPYKSKYETASTNFKEYQQVQKTYPEFNKFIDDVISEKTPDKFSFKVDDDIDEKNKAEIPVEIDLTKEQRKELETIFKSPKYYNSYTKGEKRDELKAAISKKIEGFIKANNFDAAVKQSYKTAAGIYVKKGSNVGAENLFGVSKNTPSGAPVIDINETIAASNEKMNKARRNIR